MRAAALGASNDCSTIRSANHGNFAARGSDQSAMTMLEFATRTAWAGGVALHFSPCLRIVGIDRHVARTLEGAWCALRLRIGDFLFPGERIDVRSAHLQRRGIDQRRRCFGGDVD